MSGNSLAIPICLASIRQPDEYQWWAVDESFHNGQLNARGSHEGKNLPLGKLNIILRGTWRSVDRKGNMTIYQPDDVVEAAAAVITRPGKTWAGSHNRTLHAVIDTMLVELAQLPNSPPLDQKLLGQALRLAVANSNRQLTWDGKPIPWDGRPKFNHLNAHVRKGWVEKISPGNYRLSAEGRTAAGLSNFQRHEVQVSSPVTQEFGEARSSRVPNATETDAVYLEGRDRELLKSHRRMERNANAVRDKKAKVRAETGKLLCEVCNLDFTVKYGLLGKDFAECHHIVSFSLRQGERSIQLSDLAIVCANCHRMLHRRPFHTIPELRVIVLSHRALE